MRTGLEGLWIHWKVEIKLEMVLISWKHTIKLARDKQEVLYLQWNNKH